MPRVTAAGDQEYSDLSLDRFVPYRVSILSQLMSRALARQYAEQFDLTIPEWRVMAVLGETTDLSANDLCARTLQDKVTVSRAIQRLERMGRVRRRIDGADRRRTRQRLTAKGLAIYQRIVPLAQAYQEKVLAVLNERDRRALDRLVGKLTVHLQSFDTAE